MEIQISDLVLILLLEPVNENLNLPINGVYDFSFPFHKNCVILYLILIEQFHC